eukprot:CAMPEP_0206604702 /NCGR_PEP_ID=MMETSP0325_2-20121206/49652_1 /ASSEMBLY_ACC=CAM_ASM_000347 /TAXON_ID=2866 /ORGANISM="Crypthecodinium cohnii, Strain Seligo" /LENGTH=73 /DNA_ID=CAMNT_0054119455 /DNA_START=171 /DNA_END=389 /DNA_ORIENTATION=-
MKREDDDEDKKAKTARRARGGTGRGDKEKEKGRDCAGGLRSRGNRKLLKVIGVAGMAAEDSHRLHRDMPDRAS